jgi:hypothetical protein
MQPALHTHDLASTAFDLKSDHVRQPHAVCGFLALNDLLKCTGRLHFCETCRFYAPRAKDGTQLLLYVRPVIKANQLSLATWDSCRGVCLSKTRHLSIVAWF